MSCRLELFSLFAVLILNLVKADVCKDTKPDFSAPGQRISEQKCREYNWERKRLEKCSTDADSFEFPYVGAVGYKEEESKDWVFACGTFLISERYTVTAAHCSRRRPDSRPEIVRFGNKNIVDDVKRLDVKIRSVIVHPQYKAPIKNFDIALIQLESEVPFSRSIYPVCLWSKNLDSFKFAFNPAWGVEGKEYKIRKEIAVMNVQILDHDSCVEATKPWITRLFRELSLHQICGDEQKSAVKNCQGSGGSPLITKGSLDDSDEDQIPYAYGISSFGRGCGNMTIYTRISSFIDWIEETVWPKTTPANDAIHFVE
ncbi:serine protease persephone-like [Ostrinia furnacalis]|uniref:serine protease persephone-like n=1 Tax=Ostrinia furnacalis TaxID=93504 RepID=UPI0010408B03|nr:serine protease persephone-like [Ostrinia furnacalis]